MLVKIYKLLSRMTFTDDSYNLMLQKVNHFGTSNFCQTIYVKIVAPNLWVTLNWCKIGTDLFEADTFNGL